MSAIKARFYRGPWDGKTQLVRDDQIDIIVSKMKQDAFFNPSSTTYATTPMSYNNYRYIRTRHTHPDGSVFFEWDKPKGTRL